MSRFKERYHSDPIFRQRTIERAKAYAREHPEHVKEMKRKQWLRVSDKALCTMINGERRILLNVNKRPQPTDMNCENCGNKATRLHYHHWDDRDFSKGIWVCFTCHGGITFFENGGNLTSYLRIKEKLDRGEKFG